MRNWNKIFWRDAIHSVVVGIFYSREIGCRSRSEYFIAAILPISTIFLLRLGTFRFNEMLLSPLYQTGSFERMHSSNSSNFHNSSCTIMMLFPFEYLPGSKVGGTSAEIWSNLLPLLLPSNRVSERVRIQRIPRFCSKITEIKKSLFDSYTILDPTNLYGFGKDTDTENENRRKRIEERVLYNKARRQID